MASFGIEPSTISTNGSSSPRSALKNHSRKSSAPPLGPHSKSISGQWTAIFGRPGQGAERDLLDAGLRRAGQGDRVAVAAQPGVDPQDVDDGLSSVATGRPPRAGGAGAPLRHPNVPPPDAHVNECISHLVPGRAAPGVRSPGMAVVAITATERAAFKRCRRAWDLGARVRRGLEPVDGGARAAEHPAREALAVHYFPGMWAWDRTIVRPLVLQAAGTAADVRRALRRLGGGRRRLRAPPGRVRLRRAASRTRGGDGDLAAPDGRAVHYQGRAHALVVDDDRAHWLLVHRFGPWTDRPRCSASTRRP